MKYYQVISKSITKWGDKEGITVSFQKLGNKYCCFQGNGSQEGIIGWGRNKKESAANLIARKDYPEFCGLDGFASVNILEVK